MFLSDVWCILAAGGAEMEKQKITMCLDKTNYVVQSNDLINSKQALKLNSAKLIRAAIMQVVATDTELKPYYISIPDLSRLLGVDASNLYRDIDEITIDIISNPVFIKEIKGKRVRWAKIPWVTYCTYDSELGVTIQLNALLHPYLLGLKAHYTQYTLENVLAMKSIYAIRLFELLQARIIHRKLPINGVDITFTLDEIREGCNCLDKYERFEHLRERVIDTAIKEINRVTTYRIAYSYIKHGRTVTAIKFNVNMSYHLGRTTSPDCV